METLKARILIQHVAGDTMNFIYNREAFDLLKVDRHSSENSQFVEIGQVLEINEKKYKVTNINFKLLELLHEMGDGYGINILSSTTPSDYNCQIGIFVDDVKVESQHPFGLLR